MSADKAIAYYRTSSATNVGADKDSLARQKAAVTAYAKANKITIVAEFYDAAVSGADPIEARPGFLDMLARITGNGVRSILVETANRFARDLVVQETGHRMLKDRASRSLPPTARAPSSRTRRRRLWSTRSSAPWRSSTRP